MPDILMPGATLPGFRTRARTARPANCVGVWDLMGGDASRGLKNLVRGGADLTIGGGTPVWTRWGAVLSAANWLDTFVVSGAAQLTIAVVAQRTPESVYFGNYNGAAVGDTLMDNASEQSILRYWNGAAVNFEIEHPIPFGDFFLFVGAFGNSTRGHVFGAGDVEVENAAGPSGRDHSVDNQTLRLGRGQEGSAYTDTTVLICAASAWTDVVNADDVATEIAPMHFGMTARHGLRIGRAA